MGSRLIILESNQNHATITINNPCPCLTASMGLGGGYVPMIVTQDGADIAGTLDSHYYKGCGEREGREREYIMQLPCNWDGSNVAPTLTKCNAGGGQRMPDKDNFNAVIENGKKKTYRIRRLTPLECGRLQGFPDDYCTGLAIENPTAEDIKFWTEVFETYRKATTPDKKPKTEKQIRAWLKDPYSDTNQYRMWGNGMAMPNAMHLVRGIKESAERENRRGENT